MTIDINDRLYNDIDSYCKANSLDTNEYITDIISERHYFLKYGDLNEKMETVVEQSTAEVKKKSKRTTKKKEEVVETVNETLNNSAVQPSVQEKEVIIEVEPKTVEETPKPKVQRKTKRTLKTL